ncbi:NADPH-dependent FMN reductase [Xenophilus sp.]|uniref:NADPH-dependent FMN reductase n=1 Tax=Xenophilus sp. TaxID=1873499 RepID=UPI0037DC2599
MPTHRPYIVAIGGTTRPGSSTERALRHALATMDAQTVLLCGGDLDLPLYAPHAPARTPAVARVLEHLRRADGVILGSPGYHGGISGAIKNVLDYTEELRDDERPYLSGRAVGCVATAAGHQGAATTLSALRDIVHALRGWPTPLGVCVSGSEPAFSADGRCLSAQVDQQLRILGQEVLDFARARRLAAAQPSPLQPIAKAA